jgi:hypothetical protein
MDQEEYWYRYEDRLYSSGVDEFEFPLDTPILQVKLRRYRVRKLTPCGARLENGRFVLRSAKKRWATPTVKEAEESFVARKNRQINILSNRLKHAREALKIIQKQTGAFDSRMPKKLF